MCGATCRIGVDRDSDARTVGVTVRRLDSRRELGRNDSQAEGRFRSWFLVFWLVGHEDFTASD
jgi:hypothetical protein